MVDAIDRGALEQWLRVRGASSDLIRYATADLGAEWRTAPERECATLLEGILLQAIEPVVSTARVEGLVKVARALGYREHLLDAFVVDVLRITLRRLRAYGVLGLHVGASADEVKASHRLRIKDAHPDRLIGAGTDAHEAAERQVMELNQARALLYQPLEDVKLDGDDDLELDPASEAPPPPPPVVAAPPPVAGPRTLSLEPIDLDLDPPLDLSLELELDLQLELDASSPAPPALPPAAFVEDAPTELYEEMSWSETEEGVTG